MKKGIGVGIEDFREVIREDCYYFDKTNYIEELIKDKTKIKLFTRPRRFGKTLNMSTLKYFFDVKNAEENRKLFKDLYIEKSEYFKEQGQYPVIFITMKDLKKNTWEQMNFAAKSLISKFISSQVFFFKSFNVMKITGYCPCSLKYSDFFIYKSLNSFLFSSAFFTSKKYFNVVIFNVFPNLLGRVNNFIFVLSFKSSSI